MKEFYLKMMRESETFTEAKNYAIAAGYDVGQLIRDRYFKKVF